MVGIIQVLGGFGFSLVVGVLGVWSLLLLVVYVRCCGWCAVWSVFHDWLLRGLVFVVIWWFRLVGCLVVWRLLVTVLGCCSGAGICVLGPLVGCGFWVAGV